MSSLQPIRLLPAREQVVSALRKAILTKEFQENEEISLERISNMLGVSVTPVREALQVLASEGLVILRRNKGAIIAGINAQTICDHYFIRMVLEREAAVLVCQNEEADLSEVLQVFNQMKEDMERGDYSNYSNYNQAFHMAMWTATGNVKMRLMLSTMWNGLSIGDKVSEDDYAQKSFQEHQEIVEALKNRDVALTRQLMETHIVRSRDDVLTHFE